MKRELLFIVGMPRSGTKLLRDLLNRHSDIAIFPNESHVFPYFSKNFNEFGNISDRKVFYRFYKKFAETIFYKRISEKGININYEDWYQELSGNQYKDVLDALFECYGKLTGKKIIGDKTPSYIKHVPFLADLYPNAKFIHIYRDPRDYVISINKAWGKKRIRALYRWKNQIRQFLLDVNESKVNYFSLSYESLLNDTKNVLQDLCRFIGVDFEDGMLTLACPSENLGDAKGQSIIINTNFDKWKGRMSENEIKLTESIAGNLMIELGYDILYMAGDQSPGKLHLMFCKLCDGLNLLKFSFKEEGGIIPVLKLLRRSIKV